MSVFTVSSTKCKTLSLWGKKPKVLCKVRLVRIQMDVKIHQFTALLNARHGGAPLKNHAVSNTVNAVTLHNVVKQLKIELFSLKESDLFLLPKRLGF